MSLLEYKGYIGSVEFNSDSFVLQGKIRGIDETVTFEATEVGNIEKAFHEAVDEYLAMCEANGQAPLKAYSGKFNIRIGAALHRRVNLQAIKENISLNQCVKNALKEYCDRMGDADIEDVVDSTENLTIAEQSAEAMPSVAAEAMPSVAAEAIPSVAAEAMPSVASAETKKETMADKLSSSLPDFNKIIEDYKAGRLTRDD